MYHNHSTINHRPVDQETTTGFYKHSYGGTAREIFVSREGFIRFFELEDFQYENLSTNEKVLDNFENNNDEVLGYIVEDKYGNKFHWIVYITRSVKNNTPKVSEHDYYLPLWAGYDSHGNDYPTIHFHKHHYGTFFRSDGVRGFTCAAPVVNDFCTDPISYNER